MTASLVSRLVWAVCLCLAAGRLAQAAETAATFVPPPRTIADITAILDQEKPDPAKVAAREKAAAAPVPAGLGDLDKAKFLASRAAAASGLGRMSQVLLDLRAAADLAKQHQADDPDAYPDYLSRLRSELSRSGDPQAVIAISRESIDLSEGQGRPTPRTVAAYQTLINSLARGGDIAAAQATLTHLQDVVARLNTFSRTIPYRAGFAWAVDRSRGLIAYVSGRYEEAEAADRQAILDGEEAAKSMAANGSEAIALSWASTASFSRKDLAYVLVQENKLVEAEIVARQALLSELKLRGRYAVETGDMITGLAFVIAAQARYKESEQLDKIAVDTYIALGSDPDSRNLNAARATLAAAVAGGGRWAEALQQFDLIQKSAARDAPFVQRLVLGTQAFLVASIRGGRAQQAIPLARQAMEDSEQKFGPNHFHTALQTGLYAEALAATGKDAEARTAYAKAAPVLLAGTSSDQSDTDQSGTGRLDRWRRVALDGYLAVLARAGGDAAAVEGFRIADAARGQTVQRAVVAAAARSAARDPALAELVRREQDAQRQIDALSALLASGYALPTGSRDDAALAKLRADIDQKTANRKTMRADLERRFPDYGRLTNPQPASVADAQKALQPGEALLVIYSSSDQTYVWAVPKSGPVSFAVSPLAPKDIVSILDINLDRLGYLDDIFQGRITTLNSDSAQIERAVIQADLVVGGVLIPGARAPKLVSEALIAEMSEGSVVVDVAVDQGGCIETCVPTTHDHPTYIKHGVVHYCVANMPGAVAQTSTFALTNATTPYALQIAEHGLAAAVAKSKPLSLGLNTYDGHVTYRAVAEALGYPYKSLQEAMKR